MPVGVGQPMFHSVESELSRMIFSVGGVKGVEFGLGFKFNDYYGSEVKDEFALDNDKIITTTNNNAGINAGITNGMPILIKTVVKPTPSISKIQQTVNYKSREESELTIFGRHDPCIVHRARIVIDSVIAITLVDMLLDEYGDDYFLCKKDC
jgi:chorismate synthase